MRYWWVNQKQTWRHEVPGGYLWSPKRKSNGHRNPFYEFMREVAPGDVVFSFAWAAIKAIGLVRSPAYEAPKPAEFGRTGDYWDRIGWRVDVHFHELMHQLRPAEHMAQLRARLPARYAPLRDNGHGQQNIYLTRLPEDFALTLMHLIGTEATALVQGRRVADEQPDAGPAARTRWEEHLLQEIRHDRTLAATEREALILARRGQGLFKRNVARIEHHCRLTGVDRPEHLIGSHIQPWRDADNDARLDGENGLLLTPDADHLFDRGFISFANDGHVLVSPVVDRPSLARMGLDPAQLGNVGNFTSGQKHYLDYHRENVFLCAQVRRD